MRSLARRALGPAFLCASWEPSPAGCVRPCAQLDRSQRPAWQEACARGPRDPAPGPCGGRCAGQAEPSNLLHGGSSGPWWSLLARGMLAWDLASLVNWRHREPALAPLCRDHVRVRLSLDQLVEGVEPSISTAIGEG
jgi:hypothetical protein